MDEYPVFVKAGAIIPMYGNEVMNLEENPDRLKTRDLSRGVSSGELYEDEGNNKRLCQSLCLHKLQDQEAT